RLARTEVAALHGVVEETIDRVAVVLVVLGGVDSALRRDAVRAARRILEAEALDLVAQLRERGRGGTARESGAHHEHRVLPLVRRVHQLHLEAMPLPPRLDRSAWFTRVQLDAHLTHPKRIASG